jgi:hypothetical protein
MGEDLMYYTDRDVKGSGTGGQFNPQSPKAREVLDWIYTQKPGKRILRDDAPACHQISDGEIKEAIKMNLIDDQGVRTEIGHHPSLIRSQPIDWQALWEMADK